MYRHNSMPCVLPTPACAHGAGQHTRATPTHHKKEMPLATPTYHPATAAPALVDQLIHAMPGGRFIPDAWRAETHVVTILDVQDDDAFGRVYTEICAAFGFWETASGQEWVLCTPLLIAEMLHWYAEPDVAFAAQALALEGVFAGSEPSAVAGAVAALLAEVDVHDVAERLAEVLDEASSRDIDATSALHLLASLGGDDQAVNAALAVLTTA